MDSGSLQNDQSDPGDSGMTSIGSLAEADPNSGGVLMDAGDIRAAIEERLPKLMEFDSTVPANLRDALRHAVMGRSKRVRPTLLYLIAEPGDAARDTVLDAGCALEMVHTASLIIDDLPCMDDAMLRRQRPTTHVAFGQPTAILSAIALLTQAFGIIAGLDGVSAATRNRLACILSEAVGWNGLVAGQEIDINNRAELGNAEQVEQLNWLKTGVLFTASARMGGILRGLDGERLEAVGQFARHFGLAFQTADDLIDRTDSVEQAGKDVGKDDDKATLVSLLGADHARMTCQQHIARAEQALVASGINAAPLKALMMRLLDPRQKVMPSCTPPSALAIGGLHVRYGRRDVLRGLDLSIARGEIYGLLGPNGAGKTTLIRTICGRVRPLKGSVTVSGNAPGRAALRQIGLVPQEIALYGHLTVRENLEVFGRLSGMEAAATRAAMEWASEAADLTSRLNDRIDILSGGWKRRVNIAAAILHRPALLILDEPTVGVDVDARNGLHEVIQQLSQTGMAVLLATHDLDQAETICSSVGFLRNGLVAPQGHPRKLIEEAFGAQREVILELRQLPPPAGAETLVRAGFSAFNGGLSWVMLGQASDRWVAELSASLERAGIEAREMRLRAPGLDRLFVHLSREAAAERLP
jgi:ABC-type multidrug transport system ATPase subunit/geranylgeranyl pyrophosphate synthase